jgi:NAD-reducing hydrogenase large subunit
MHYGQILQSHALHFFHLASPDLLFGFDADPAKRNVVGVLAAHPELARQGILLRKFGQESSASPPASGSTAPARSRAASTSRSPSPSATSCGAAARRAGLGPGRGALVADLHAPTARSTRGSARCARACCRWWRPTARSICTTACCAPATPTARSSSTACAARTTARSIRENVRSWSYMKFPFFAALGPERGWYKVGPLARIQNCDAIGTPLAEAARQELLAQAAAAISTRRWRSTGRG